MGEQIGPNQEELSKKVGEFIDNPQPTLPDEDVFLHGKALVSNSQEWQAHKQERSEGKDPQEQWQEEYDKIKSRLENFEGKEMELFTEGKDADLFRRDVEVCCRHALAMGADTILFLDKSARPYGYLAEKMLPIIQLEYSKMMNVPLEEIKIPNVAFVNSPHGDLELKTSKELEERDQRLEDRLAEIREFKEQSDEPEKIQATIDAIILDHPATRNRTQRWQDSLKNLIGGKTLIFDESTTHDRRDYDLGKIDAIDDPKEHYLYFQQLQKQLGGSRMIQWQWSAFRFMLNLEKIFPDNKFQVQVGSSPGYGGWAKNASKVSDELRNGIFDPDEGNNEGSRERVFLDQISYPPEAMTDLKERRFDSVAEYKKQYDLDLTLLAKKSFERLSQ